MQWCFSDFWLIIWLESTISFGVYTIILTRQSIFWYKIRLVINRLCHGLQRKGHGKVVFHDFFSQSTCKHLTLIIAWKHSQARASIELYAFEGESWREYYPIRSIQWCEMCTNLTLQFDGIEKKGWTTQHRLCAVKSVRSVSFDGNVNFPSFCAHNACILTRKFGISVWINYPSENASTCEDWSIWVA